MVNVHFPQFLPLTAVKDRKFHELLLALNPELKDCEGVCHAQSPQTLTFKSDPPFKFISYNWLLIFDADMD